MLIVALQQKEAGLLIATTPLAVKFCRATGQVDCKCRRRRCCRTLIATLTAFSLVDCFMLIVSLQQKEAGILAAIPPLAVEFCPVAA
jgi:hypothetical protein